MSIVSLYCPRCKQTWEGKDHTEEYHWKKPATTEVKLGYCPKCVLSMERGR